MSIHSKIKSEIKEAMLAKNQDKLGVVRGLSAAFTNELVAKGRKPQEELRDEEALAVIQRSAKQRKDSIEQFRKGGRNDLAEIEEKELKILETYLPKMMVKSEIKKIALEVKDRLAITDKQKMGELMGAVMKEVKGKALGSDVKEVVESLFQI